MLVLDNLVLVLENESGSPHHVTSHHTQYVGIGLRKLVILILNIHQIFNRGFSSSSDLFVAHMLI